MFVWLCVWVQTGQQFIELTGSALAVPALADQSLAKLAASHEIPADVIGLPCGGCGSTRYKRVPDGYNFPETPLPMAGTVAASIATSSC